MDESKKNERIRAEILQEAEKTIFPLQNENKDLKSKVSLH